VRYLFLSLAIFGIIISACTIREHYHEGTSPCDINDKWDCGVVNHSPFAVVSGILGLGDGAAIEGEAKPGRVTVLLSKIPLGAAGIAGYLLIGALGFFRRYRLLLIPVLFALGFSIYLTHYVEARLLGVYCIYCVISYGTIILLTLLNVGVVAAQWIKGHRTAAQE
jgi:uncharacterized membrane protein